MQRVGFAHGSSWHVPCTAPKWGTRKKKREREKEGLVLFPLRTTRPLACMLRTANCAAVWYQHLIAGYNLQDASACWFYLCCYSFCRLSCYPLKTRDGTVTSFVMCFAGYPSAYQGVAANHPGVIYQPRMQCKLHSRRNETSDKMRIKFFICPLSPPPFPSFGSGQPHRLSACAHVPTKVTQYAYYGFFPSR